MSNPEAILTNLENSIDQFEGAVDLLLDPEFSKDINKMDTLDKCQLEVLMCYALNHNLWSYMILKGIDVKEHPILRELERVREYVKRIQDLQGKNKPNLRVNVPASKRVIAHALAENDREEEKEISKTKSTKNKNTKNGKIGKK